MTRIPRSAAAITFAAVVACTGDPVSLCACLTGPNIMVYGQVTDPSGAAVPGATVRLEAMPVRCEGTPHVTLPETDGTGRYRGAVFAITQWTEQCLRMTALPPAGSGLRSSETVEVTIATPQRVRGDSLRQDFTLRAQ
ncbi:MAG TPA: carboxypeptidase-like regulatory domain-containing protein [Longimicrobium sp.]|nr:carboxypeptidase-like regulatory domain-containing protein [Longimicrobium sp.]